MQYRILGKRKLKFSVLTTWLGVVLVLFLFIFFGVVRALDVVGDFTRRERERNTGRKCVYALAAEQRCVGLLVAVGP